MALKAEQTLRNVLSGSAGVVRGLTYVPSDALATVMLAAALGRSLRVTSVPQRETPSCALNLLNGRVLGEDGGSRM